MEKKKLTTEEDYRLRVDRVTTYIREHLDRDIDRNVYANGGMIHCVTQQQPR